MYIGGEAYQVQVVEECGYVTQHCYCRRRSDMGSSEEIESIESEFSTLILGFVDASEKEDQSEDTTVSETEAGLRGTTLSPNVDNGNHRIPIIHNGQREKENPQDNGNTSRLMKNTQKVNKQGTKGSWVVSQAARQWRGKNLTYPDEVARKVGELHTVGIINPTEEVLFNHEDGKQVGEVSSDVEGP